jgi:hypothetical protein
MVHFATPPELATNKVPGVNFLEIYGNVSKSQRLEDFNFW